MAQLKHIGVLGMRWGHRKRVQNNTRVAKTGVGTFQPTYQYRDTQGNVVSRYGPGKYGGPKGDNEKPRSDVKSDKKFMRDAERISKNMPASKAAADFQKATGKSVPKGSVGDRIFKSLGCKKDKKGVWQMTPEAHMKATAFGIGLGTVAFFAEMKLKKFVTSGAAEKMLQQAEYARWLKYG